MTQPTTEKPSDPDNCGCMCLSSGFMQLIRKIVRFFYMIFGVNKVCTCGVSHY